MTKYVDSHRVNPNYPTLRIEFELPKDDNFRIRSMFEADWCPRDDEIIEVVEKMLDISPTFGPKLAKRLEAKSKLLWRLLSEYAFALHQVKPHLEGILGKRRGA
ncbi:MAG: hypothetical protein QXQ94_10105 [Candidatus Bathyarchaeia archaeon]